METIKERTKLTKVIMAAIKEGLTLKDLERLFSARVQSSAINCNPKTNPIPKSKALTD